MIKKSLFITVILAVFVLSACSNILGPGAEGKVSFTLGKDTAEQISKAAVDDNSEFDILFQFDGISLKDEHRIVQKKNLEKEILNFENIPLNREFKILITVSFNGHVIYEGESDPVTLTADTNGKAVEIKINPKPGKITYVENGGTMQEPKSIIQEYFIYDQVELPKMEERTGYTFDGWYFNEKCTDKVTDLGQKNYRGDVKLYAKWSLNPVTDFSVAVVAGEPAVTVSWTNPPAADLDRVEITYKDYNENRELVDIGVTVEKTEFDAEGLCSKKIPVSYGAKIGKDTVFCLQAFNTKGSFSKIEETNEEFEVNPYNLTLVPKTLSAGTNGTGGTDKTYIEFGDWPQTKYPKDGTPLSSCADINGWTDCYTDGNGGYYVKVKATPDGSVKDYTNGEICYFKIEPIRWRVLTNDYVDAEGHHTGKLLLAEKTLVAHAYSEISANDFDSNKYDSSVIRYYLKNEFMNKAFTPVAISKIADTVVDNSPGSTFGTGQDSKKGNQYACGDTTDKIFLLSEKEVTAAEYGFGACNFYDNSRIRYPTDYAKATGIWINNDNKCNWWLRSPDYDNYDHAFYVDTTGKTETNNFVNQAYKGVVPALAISF